MSTTLVQLISPEKVVADILLAESCRAMFIPPPRKVAPTLAALKSRANKVVAQLQQRKATVTSAAALASTRSKATSTPPVPGRNDGGEAAHLIGALRMPPRNDPAAFDPRPPAHHQNSAVRGDNEAAPLHDPMHVETRTEGKRLTPSLNKRGVLKQWAVTLLSLAAIACGILLMVVGLLVLSGIA